MSSYRVGLRFAAVVCATIVSMRPAAAQTCDTLEIAAVEKHIQGVNRAYNEVRGLLLRRDSIDQKKVSESINSLVVSLPLKPDADLPALLNRELWKQVATNVRSLEKLAALPKQVDQAEFQGRQARIRQEIQERIQEDLRETPLGQKIARVAAIVAAEQTVNRVTQDNAVLWRGAAEGQQFRILEDEWVALQREIDRQVEQLRSNCRPPTANPLENIDKLLKRLEQRVAELDSKVSVPLHGPTFGIGVSAYEEDVAGIGGLYFFPATAGPLANGVVGAQGLIARGPDETAFGGTLEGGRRYGAVALLIGMTYLDREDREIALSGSSLWVLRPGLALGATYSARDGIGLRVLHIWGKTSSPGRPRKVAPTPPGGSPTASTQ